jgi:beta-lactamase superfamily II metal-dependent hydrolase
MTTNIPAAQLIAGDFKGSLTDDSWVYFLCNVGDGDSQLILLPVDETGERRAIVVDAYTDKVTQLVNHLTTEGVLPGPPAKALALVVATHPHQDHISNMPNLFRIHGDRIAEFWDPGYYHPISSYTSLMEQVQRRRSSLTYAQPSGGLRRWIGRSLVTVLSPAVGLRNRFDTYGTEINDASISLRIDHPAVRLQARDSQRRLVDTSDGRSSLILGADAQTLSWAHVMVDFPYLPSSKTEAARAIAGATGTKDLLNTDVVKVSHHGSKRGVSLELMERFSASVILVSSRAPHESTHNFPHSLTTEIIREVKEPTATRTALAPRRADWAHDIYYTHDVDDAATALGTIGIVFRGRSRQLWRFGDDRLTPIDTRHARKKV